MQKTCKNNKLRINKMERVFKNTWEKVGRTVISSDIFSLNRRLCEKTSTTAQHSSHISNKHRLIPSFGTKIAEL